MKYIVTINDKSYEVEVESGQATVVKTTKVTAPVIQVVPVAQVVSAPTAPAASVVSNAAGEALKAPMPGTILEVKVTPGTTVKKGDVVFILEAMKMENEITAPKDGVVSQIMVAKGASVSTGDVLAVIQ